LEETITMTSKQSQLKSLFEERKSVFHAITNDILTHLQPNILAGISAYFRLHNELDEPRRIAWDDVGYVEQHDMLILLGSITYDIGSTVVDEYGETVTITEELAPYFNRVVRVGLPLKFVEATDEEVLSFLLQRDNQTEKEQQAAVDFLREIIGEGNDESSSDTEFDLDQLTEDQKARLVPTKINKVIN
jgi:hypothetical protein